jgi:hypothetical protein
VTRDHSVEIFIYGTPWSPRFSAKFFPEKQYGDSIYFEKCLKDSCDYKRIFVNKIEQDSLYKLFEEVNSNFTLSNKQFTVNDVPKVSIIIGSKSNKMSFSFGDLTSPDDASPAVGRLVKFINSRLSQEDQMY